MVVIWRRDLLVFVHVHGGECLFTYASTRKNAKYFQFNFYELFKELDLKKINTISNSSHGLHSVRHMKPVDGTLCVHAITSNQKIVL
jgi:hypothetical protein